MAPPGPTTRATSRGEWRRWLEQHHRSATEIWLVFPKKHTNRATVTYAESVEEALCFGWIDGVIHRVDADEYAQRFAPRRAGSIWSKANVERVARLEEAGLMRAEGRVHVAAAKRSGQWAAAYATADEVECPPPLVAELARSKRVKAAWDALTPGQQKGWSRQVLAVKSDAARAKKATEAVLLFLAGRKAGETDAQAAARGLPSKAELLAAGSGAAKPRRAPARPSGATGRGGAARGVGRRRS